MKFMRAKTTSSIPVLLFGLLFTAHHSRAQVSESSLGKAGSIYFSIGTNSATFKSTDISIDQGAGNLYDLQNVKGDNKLSGNSSILNYNLRLGYYFNKYQTMGVELDYNPVSYHVVDGQTVQMVGRLDNAAVDKPLVFSSTGGYSYYLNGSNLVLINFVRRFGLFRNKMRTFSVDALAKAGAGPAMPRVLNTIAGKTTDHSSFKLAGWNAALEAAVRFTVVRHVYFEAAYKYDHASYNVDVYNGSASHSLTTSEFIFSLGYTFSTTRHNPLFQKAHKQRRILTIGSMNHAGDE
jgi:hypothetical protein